MTTPLISIDRDKDNKFISQLKTVYRYLTSNTATASMVSDATGIQQKNITRYKRDLENWGHLKQIKKDRCSVTGRRAWYLTTNKELFITTGIQYSLFEPLEGFNDVR